MSPRFVPMIPTTGQVPPHASSQAILSSNRFTFAGRTKPMMCSCVIRFESIARRYSFGSDPIHSYWKDRMRGSVCLRSDRQSLTLAGQQLSPEAYCRVPAQHRNSKRGHMFQPNLNRQSVIRVFLNRLIIESTACLRASPSACSNGCPSDRLISLWVCRVVLSTFAASVPESFDLSLLDTSRAMSLCKRRGQLVYDCIARSDAFSVCASINSKLKVNSSPRSTRRPFSCLHIQLFADGLCICFLALVANCRTRFH
jgi:hypothetical protein